MMDKEEFSRRVGTIMSMLEDLSKEAPVTMDIVAKTSPGYFKEFSDKACKILAIENTEMLPESVVFSLESGNKFQICIDSDKFTLLKNQ